MAQHVDIIVPEDSQEGTETAVSAWMKEVGDQVEKDEPLLELSTDKVNIEVAAPQSGRLEEILAKAGQEVEPGQVLGRILVGAEAGDDAAGPRRAQGHWGLEDARPETAFSAGQADDARQRLSKKERLSPAVRRLVKEHGLDVSRIPGSGRGGRVTFGDAQKHLQGGAARPSGTQPGRVAGDGDEPVVVSSPDEGVGHRFIRHTTMRRKIASHMVQSMLQTAPHVTAVFEADLTQVAAHLAANRHDFLKRGTKLTYTAYFVDAAVQALQAVPEINSRWHDDGLEIFADCNIGIAAAVEGGLVVPVIRQAQSRSLFGIAQKLQDLTERARKGKLTEEDMRYGTFTITNHGVSGSLIATPIIHQPQSAILGVGKLQKRVVVEQVRGADALVIRPMTYLTLTIDHRALDGYQANTFLSRFVEILDGWPTD